MIPILITVPIVLILGLIWISKKSKCEPTDSIDYEQWCLNNPEIIKMQLETQLKFLESVLPELRLYREAKKQVEKRLVCRNFVLRKYCKFGVKCMFQHTLDLDLVMASPCVYGIDCRFKDTTCLFNHSTVVESDEYMCSICLSDIHKCGKIFGILENCNHTFCNKCIRTHRINATFSRKIRLGCPICRVVSNDYISSKTFVTGSAKVQEFKRINNKRNNIDCMYKHNCKKVQCPYKHSC
jgi:hypothetical protein